MSTRTRITLLLVTAFLCTPLAAGDPVVSDGRLYIRHGEFLYFYDVRAKK